jgi:hypothetical protein
LKNKNKREKKHSSNRQRLPWAIVLALMPFLGFKLHINLSNSFRRKGRAWLGGSQLFKVSDRLNLIRQRKKEKKKIDSF